MPTICTRGSSWPGPAGGARAQAGAVHSRSQSHQANKSDIRCKMLRTKGPLAQRHWLALVISASWSL